MATHFSLKALAVLASALVLCVRGALGGGVTCENLDKDACAFAVSSSGTRCVLEKHVKRGGEEVYACRASDIEADRLKDWIESNECVEACGVDRRTVGISSDALLDSHFTQKLCSSQCHGRCPNIVDLYFNLAAGEGVFLPKLCETHGANGRRGMAEIRSSGIAAPAPYYSMSMHSKDGIAAPGPDYGMHSNAMVAPAMAPY